MKKIEKMPPMTQEQGQRVAELIMEAAKARAKLPAAKRAAKEAERRYKRAERKIRPLETASDNATYRVEDLETDIGVAERQIEAIKADARRAVRPRHLHRGAGGLVWHGTVCGKQTLALRDYTTADPNEVTCAKCLAADDERR
ncbi:MAG TPA: hypothetical protein VJM14_15010 [Burkholderiales bacterium]|nr:hypothetical protein [Burkholderiales bacterium]